MPRDHESDDEFCRRIEVQNDAIADQSWMRLDARLQDVMRITMDLHRGEILCLEDRKFTAQVMALVGHEIAQRRRAREAETV